MQDFAIRAATPYDAAALLEIYAPYVEKTAITFEYEVPSENEFRERIESTLRRYPYLVAESGGRIIGYAYAGEFHKRPAYGWAAETSIYVGRDCRRNGVGKALYERLEGALRLMGILSLCACIAYCDREDEHLTQGSVHFHESLGYSMVGRFHKCGYKFSRWYDMVWMEKLIGEHSENQQPVKRFDEIRKEAGL
ncbi:MAG: GNAT family N-acetyltransferase [Eubacteriales bacterium]|nr:GNAT family N-acetyltransferase [Eubacteriales bacterium]MDD3882686.1 GNAT family N-acetyltransferase [Eubacteriales bacterium]MDD4512742.1 GNAT family N-acetyltransferase [Eubacteriales bacterium]